MKVVFMGTPDFSVGALREIVKAGHEVVAVVTQPDRQKGRGKKVLFPAVKEAALELGLDVYQPEKVKEASFVELLRGLKADIMVVSAFGQILPSEILHMTKYGCINIHASLLPKYRGAAPIQWAIIDGEEKTGVTIMQMNEGLDTGDILTVEEVVIGEKETGGSLFDKLAKVGASLVVSTLEKIEKQEVTPIKQDDAKSNYAKMLKKELGNINFHQSAVEIERLIRGLTPWPSAYTHIHNKTLKVWDADVSEKNYEGAVPGQVMDMDKTSMYVATGDGTLIINEVQLEGKKRMGTADLLRGYTIEKGEVLG